MHLSVICDSRIWVSSKHMESFNMKDCILHSGLSHLVLIPQHAKLLFLPITLQHVGIWSTKTPNLDVRTALQAVTKCMTKERGSCAPWMRPESQWAIESNKVNCRRPLLAVTETTDCGRWVCFGPQRQGFSFDPRTGQKIEFTPTPGGWDLTMKLGPPERGNKILNKAIQENSANKRTAAVARDYGAITDTGGLVRIMGCDLFGRLGFGL